MTYGTFPPLAPLAAWAGRLAPGAVRFGAWKGGGGDGCGGIAMPFVEYHPRVRAFIEEAYERGWVLGDFDWPGWLAQLDAQRLSSDPDAVADAAEADLFRLLTAILRRERFSDGALLGALEAGTIDAVARRAAVLAQG